VVEWKPSPAVARVGLLFADRCHCLMLYSPNCGVHVGADCLLRIVGGQKFVLLLASWSSGSSGSPIVELLPRDLPERRGWKLSWLRLIGERASLRDAASFIPSVWLPLVSTRTCCGASIEVATECLR
jgi:hypothetical protein